MATEHPIQGLMKTALENIKEMVDVNTIVGDAVETKDGQVIIPVSKVGFGFGAGGSEFTTNLSHDQHQNNGENHREKNNSPYPFGGGSGGGVSITPVAFIVVGDKGIRLLSLSGQTSIYERLIDLAPQVLDRLGLRKKPDVIKGEIKVVETEEEETT